MSDIERIVNLVLDFPGIPADLVARLAEDTSWNVRYGVAQRADLPADLVARLAEDTSWNVRAAIRNRLQ